jgi:hypothetical protein
MNMLCAFPGRKSCLPALGVISATALLTLVVTTSAHAQNWMTNGLIAHYPMHGNANDVSGQGMHGSIMGSPMMATNRFGEPGHGLAFAGGMDAIMLTNLNVNMTTNRQNTVCLWMRWDGGVNGSTNPVAMPFGWADANQNYCLLFQRQGNGRFGFSGGMADVYGMDYGPALSNHWVHVAAVFNNGNMMNSGLFINGQRVMGSMTVGGMPMGMGMMVQRSAHPMAFLGGFGGQGSLPYQFFGAMSDVRIYNRALTEEEISALFRMDAGPYVRMMAGGTPGTANLEFSSMIMDWQFQMQFSSDLAHWTNYSDMFMPSASSMVRTVDAGMPHMFWRLQVNP